MLVSQSIRSEGIAESQVREIKIFWSYALVDILFLTYNYSIFNHYLNYIDN